MTIQSKDKFKAHTAGVAEIDVKQLIKEARHSPEQHYERWASLTKHSTTLFRRSLVGFSTHDAK